MSQLLALSVILWAFIFVVYLIACAASCNGRQGVKNYPWWTLPGWLLSQLVLITTIASFIVLLLYPLYYLFVK